MAASQPENYEAASEHLRAYVVGHIAVHGSLPPDIDDVYDKMVLFGDNEWVPPVSEKADTPQATQVASGALYHPTVWETPAELATAPVHPRVCGEQLQTASDRTVAGEQGSGHGRFIPAFAGNSHALNERRTAEAVHPRVCREQTRCYVTDSRHLLQAQNSYRHSVHRRWSR